LVKPLPRGLIWGNPITGFFHSNLILGINWGGNSYLIPWPGSKAFNLGGLIWPFIWKLWRVIGLPPQYLEVRPSGTHLGAQGKHKPSFNLSPKLEHFVVKHRGFWH